MNKCAAIIFPGQPWRCTLPSGHDGKCAYVNLSALGVAPGESAKLDGYMVDVGFACEVEQHNLQEFQKAGHFVCGLTDDAGFRREWATSEVHILTLRYKGEQVLRVMADTHGEAVRIMEAELRNTFFALWMNSRQVGFNHTAWTELNDQRNQFQSWLNAAYAHEIETGKHQAFRNVFDAAVHYMRKERSRLSVRIGRLMRREKRVVQSDWVPQEWKQ